MVYYYLLFPSAVIYYKTYHEIFTLFRVMQQQSHWAPIYAQDAEHAGWNVGVPYHPYLSYLPLKP